MMALWKAAKALTQRSTTMSASYLFDAEREKAGIPELLVRTPVGIKHVDDLHADLEQALAHL